MLLVETWKNYQEEKKNITQEVSNILVIYQLSNGLESSDSSAIKYLTKQFVQEVINDTWPTLEKRIPNTVATPTLNKLYLRILNIKIENDRHLEIRRNQINSLERIITLRRLRSLKATESIIPDQMWPILAVCVFISISSSCFFCIKPLKIHIILSAFQSTMLTLVVFLIFSLMYPYRGLMRIKPEPFERLLKMAFKNIDNVKF